MTRKILLASGVLLVLGFALNKPLGLYLHFLPYFFAGPAPIADCGEGPGFRYCADHPPHGTAEDPDSVLYFLHYGSGDEKSWTVIPISRVFYTEFRKRGVKAPTVISISYGPYWTLFDKGGGRLASPIASDFLDRAMPWLDKKFAAPKRRYLWGMSQGGLNSALLIFKRPKLWAGAVLACPALYDFDLFAPKREIAAYAARHDLKLDRLQYVMDLVLNRIAMPQEWKREDPLVRVKKFSSPLPPIYVDCNRKDEFGLCSGARAFVDSLKARGSAVTFEEEPGEHCAVDPEPPSRFIADIQSRTGTLRGAER